MGLMSVAVCVASHTSRVSTVYLLYLFVLLLLICVHTALQNVAADL